MSTPDPERQGYGSIPASSVEEAEAREGPFPVRLKFRLVAEFLGTFLWVVMGLCGNCAVYYLHYNMNTAVIWGLAAMIAMYCTAAVSGGHLNPAVSFSFALTRPADFSFRKLFYYLLPQILGAMLAAVTTLFLFHKVIQKQERKYKIHRDDYPKAIEVVAPFGDYWSLHPKYVVNDVHVFFIEAFGTFLYVFTIFCLSNYKNPLPGSAIPLIVGVVYGVQVATLGSMTGGGCFNPARELGPRIVLWLAGWTHTVAFEHILPYILGPLFGGPLGAFVADKILMM